MQHPNAIMATSSADRISTAGSYQPYQNFRIQTAGGNIIQGQLNKIRVGEIMFPYDIPTVVQNKNDFFAIGVLAIDGATGTTTVTAQGITLPPSFYTAAEIVTAISSDLSGTLANLTIAEDPISGSIYFVNSGTWVGVGTNYVYLPLPAVNTNVAGGPYANPSALWTLGFKNLYSATGFNPVLQGAGALTIGIVALIPSGYPNVAPYPVINDGALRAMVGTPYNGRYTDYIDICSPALCQAQYIRDGNTQQTVIHRDLIARLYVANEISTYQSDPTGDRPFVIHRQFKNAKVMKWTADRSIDAIDIQLYDQWGLPLPNAPAMLIEDLDTIALGAIGFSGSRDFAITFLVDEPGAEEQNENVGYRI